MSDYTVPARRRSRSLLIVEGNYEKELYRLIFKAFPELNIDIDDVWIYETNIYELYNDIVKAYGDDWAEEEMQEIMDIDLPLIISRKKYPDKICYKEDFTNIIIVFDYERHDPEFSIEKILQMQNCFKDSTDMGKLYLNYPMIESCLHLKYLHDADYMNRKVPVALQPGSKYKKLVKEESGIAETINFRHKIDDVLEKYYQLNDEEEREKSCNAILEISSNNVEEELEDILHIIGNKREETTLKYQFAHWIKKIGYVDKNKNYWQYIREVFQQIICHNICKADKIQNQEMDEQEELQEKFERIDLTQILNVQNEASKDEETGFIWVLSTCTFLIPDYNFGIVPSN